MKIGFVASAFDLLHAGHLMMLKDARSLCDLLVVGLHTDPTIDRPDTKEKPVESVLERFIRLEACKYVDRIIPYETEEDLYNLLCVLRPDIRFLGSDYVGKDYTGKGLTPEIRFINRSHNFSSSKLRAKLRS